ncbi:MAG TPA: glycosyltransferase family A protein [Anaerolineales bacterium]|nr:glycosyltransferase family A protein [Anaerolineales bacterium]
MRIGQNPAKFVESVPQPARVTVAIISYIPFLSGYYAQSLDVFKACLNSLWAHSDLPYDLLVFDNASCAEVRAWLSEQHEAGKIQYLVLSDRNLGKAAAWNFVFAAAPGELIAYADADIYFEKGWLSALVKVLDAFPNAGMVTGIPMWSPAQFSTATVAWAEQTDGVMLERGKLLAWEDYWKHARSLGQEETEARENFGKQEDVRVTIRRFGDSTIQRFSESASQQVGKPTNLQTSQRTNEPTNQQFFIGAGHFQFVTRKSVLQQVIPIPAEKPMGQVRRLDVAINERGYLRLSTPEWWVRHMGNVVPDWAREIAQTTVPPRGPVKGGTGRGWVRGPVRGFIQWVYHKAFDLLYKG